MFELAMLKSRRILAIFLILACALAAFASQPLWQPSSAQAAPLEQAKPIPHSVQGSEHCLTCHQPGSGVKPAPADHAGRPESSCLGCHQPAAPAAAATAAPAAASTATQQPSSTSTGNTSGAAAQAGATAQASPDPVAASAACRTCHNTP